MDDAQWNKLNITKNAMSPKDVVDKISNSGISSVPSTVARILEVVSNKDAGAIDLKKVIEIDPPLTSRVLRIANSSYYGARQSINDILQAIVFIGFDNVKEIALSQKVCQLFAGRVSGGGYSSLSLWRHSVAVAICGKAIYRKIFRLQGHDIYCVGLIHDIGIIIEEQAIPDKFQFIVKSMNENNKNLMESEIDVIGITHADIGKEAAKQWNFSEYAIASMEFDEQLSPYSQSSGESTELNRIINTLFVANYACRSQDVGFKEVNKENIKQYNECLTLLAIDQKELDIIMKDVRKEISSMAEQGLF
jgi:HD-like signal output (HDOD) protein